MNKNVKLIEKRIRDLKRVILHTGSNKLRATYKSHLFYLEKQLKELKRSAEDV